VVLDYFAKAAGPVRVTVTDKAGNRVRQLNARAEAGGINRVLWDMRYDAPVPPAAGATGTGGGRGGRGGRGGGAAAAEAEAGPGAEAAGGGRGEAGGELQTEFGAAGGEGGEGGRGGGGGRGLFGGGGRGSLVDPGEYKVTIAAGDKSDSRMVTVEEDPRVQFSTDDRTKRRRALDTLAALSREADAARRRAVGMNNALTSLTESWKQPNAPAVPDAVKKAADDLLARTKTAAAMFETPGGFGGRGGGGGGAGPPLTYTPPPVPQKIARLMGSIDSYSSAPTSQQMADIEEVSAQLKKATADVNQLWDEVPKLNKMMVDAGVPYFTINPNPPPAGGRGGRGN
jgi:hypothetical protein